MLEYWGKTGHKFLNQTNTLTFLWQKDIKGPQQNNSAQFSSENQKGRLRFPNFHQHILHITTDFYFE